MLIIIAGGAGRVIRRAAFSALKPCPVGKLMGFYEDLNIKEKLSDHRT
jgi:hypothetical protein